MRFGSQTAAALSLWALLLCLLGPPAAGAASYSAYLCQTPNLAEPLGPPALLQVQSAGASGQFLQRCSEPKEGVVVELAGEGRVGGGEGLWFEVVPPQYVTIAALSASLTATLPRCGSAPCGAEAFLRLGATPTGPALYEDREAGTATRLVSASALEGENPLLFGLICPEAATCSGAEPLGRLELSFALLSLVDRSKLAATLGPLPTSPLSGSPPVSLSGSDPGGGGLYRYGVEVDGKPFLSPAPFSAAPPTCRELSGLGERAFPAVRPCAQSGSATFSLPTDALLDGRHQLSVWVEDVGGERVAAFDGPLETDNRPLPAAPPALLGSPAVGVAFAAQPPRFVAREGDQIVEEGGWWELCRGGNCAPIPGATSSLYTPTAADLGSRLRFSAFAVATAAQRTAADLLHRETATSQESLPVAPPPCAKRCLPALGSKRPWRLSFSVSPRLVEGGSRIRLRGVVLSRPLPPDGKLILLQARAMRPYGRGRRRRLIKSPWVTFMAIRSSRNGRFQAFYRFRLGGHHLYAFRAVAPAEGLYRNPTGYSRPVRVRER